MESIRSSGNLQSDMAPETTTLLVGSGASGSLGLRVLFRWPFLFGGILIGRKKMTGLMVGIPAWERICMGD